MEILGGLSRTLPEKEEILSPVLDKYSAVMREDPIWVNLVKYSKLSLQNNIWYLDCFECVEFDSDISCFCLVLFEVNLNQKTKLPTSVEMWYLD